MRLLRSRGLGAGVSGVLADAMDLASVLPDDDGDRDLRADLEMAGDLLGGTASARRA